jgi:hypothetical protein
MFRLIALIGLLLLLNVAFASAPSNPLLKEKILLRDDFSYSIPKGYLQKWIEEEWDEQNYSLVYVKNGKLNMLVPKGAVLLNKVCSKTTFQTAGTTFQVRFRIVNPQPEVNYAIFVYADYRIETATHKLQELDWEFSATQGKQQLCYYYGINGSDDKAHTHPLFGKWEKIGTYADWTTLSFQLFPDHFEVYLNCQLVWKSTVENSATGSFDANRLRLYFETSAGTKAMGRNPPTKDSTFQIDWVKVARIR